MGIEFCPNCGTILTITPQNDKQYLFCNNCQTKIEQDSKEIIIKSEPQKHKSIGNGVAEKKDFSGHNFKCKQCGNDKCKLVDLGMMIGDEDWVYLLQCTKCDYGERVGEWC